MHFISFEHFLMCLSWVVKVFMKYACWLREMLTIVILSVISINFKFPNVYLNNGFQNLF